MSSSQTPEKPFANVLNLGHYRSPKSVRFHSKAIDFIRNQSPALRQDFGKALKDVQDGVSLGFPLSRPMPVIAAGAHELRLRDDGIAVRIFYFVKLPNEILVFHGFQKKTQTTPKHEIDLASKRLREVLNGKA